MPSPIKPTKSFKEPQEMHSTKNKFQDSFEEKSEESLHSMQVPPLEKLTVDLTNEISDSPESAHSLTLSHKEKEEEEESSDDDDESSSDDDDDELYAGLSKEEKAKIKLAMGGIQNEFEEQQKIERKERIQKVKDTVAFNLSIDVSDEQALFIDEFVTENQYNLEQELQDEGVNFLEGMKEMMQQKALLNANHNNNNNDNQYENDNNFEQDYDFGSDDDDEDWVQNEKKKKAKRAQKRKGIPKNTNLDGSKRCGRLLLNEALKNPQDQSKWSDARKKAWKNRKTAQNAYFYRFNVPGQPQKNGKWTKSEHELFMKRVLNFGVNDQWGVFSKAIPGRVGYQCSNYWRGLVKDGDVTDPNYFYDGKKLHFKRNTKQFSIKPEYRKYAITINRDISGIWKPLPKKHPKHPSNEYCQQVQQALASQITSSNNGNNNGGKRKNNKRKRKNDNDSDEEFQGPSQQKKKRRRRGGDNDDVYYSNVGVVASVSDDNPLPDFKDIITGSNIIRPAISPYGHVLGYDTWTKILRTTKKEKYVSIYMAKNDTKIINKINKG